MYIQKQKSQKRMIGFMYLHDKDDMMDHLKWYFVFHREFQLGRNG